MIVKRFSILIFVITLYSCFALSQTAAPAPASKLLELKVPAPSLKGNLLGDPTEQQIYVYLPPSYSSESAKRYPTLYLLHGFLGRSSNWVNGAYQGMNLQTMMDAQIKAGRVREMIVVAANGLNSYGGSFYTNSPVTGNWEDFIIRDLVNNIDLNYRTLARPESRGIVGHSMGGYGAVMLGMKHPEIFSALYALSPCCLVMEDDMSESNPSWVSVNRLKGRDELKTRPQSLTEFYNSVFVALSAAFSPNISKAPFFSDFLVTEKPGCTPTTPTSCLQKNESVLASWRSHLPVYIAADNKENLMKLKGIFVDYGEKENFAHIVKGSQQFSRALAELGIPHQFEIYPDGDHGSRVKLRLETRVMQFFNEKLMF